jgi:hypothetical protein
MRLSAIIVAWIVLILCESIMAQNSARVTGIAYTSTEFSEAVVPGASIIFKTGSIEHKAIADKQGRYEIKLPEAVYQVVGGIGGFCPINRPNIPIKANIETMINIRLIICGQADGLEIDKDGNVIREIGWQTSPVEIETRRFTKARDSTVEVSFEFVSRQIGTESVEYRGSFIGNYNLTAAARYRELALYADSIVLDEKSLHIQASGHVTVEDGRKRRSARIATLNLGSSDVIGSLVMAGEEDTEIGRSTSP